MIEEPSYMTALHALVPEVKEKNLCVIFDGRANVTYWEKYDAEPPLYLIILALEPVVCPIIISSF